MKFLWYNLHHVGDHAFISKSWKSYKVTSVSELEKSRNIVVQPPRWGLNFLVHNQQICLESKIKCINSIDLLLFSFFSPFSPYFSLFFFSFRKPTYLSWPPKNGRHFVSHIHHTLKLKNLKVIKTVSRFKKVYKIYENIGNLEFSSRARRIRFFFQFRIFNICLYLSFPTSSLFSSYEYCSSY